MEMGLPEDYYQTMVNTINRITPDEIRDLAGKYLDEQTMIRSVAGKCE
jgi:predicted Zn-dependent peptidase